MPSRENEYGRISYGDVADWIGAMIPRCPAPLQVPLKQYNRVARRLREETKGWTMNDDDLAQFLSGPENLPYTLRIASALASVRERLN
jgi:hypothetical protein